MKKHAGYQLLEGQLRRPMSVRDAEHPGFTLELEPGTELARLGFATFGEVLAFQESLPAGDGQVLRVHSGAAAGRLVRLSRRDQRRFRSDMADVPGTDDAIRLDPLTGGVNSAGLLADAGRRLAVTGSVAWLHFDIENFATYNRDHGHSVGDDLLRTLADRVREARPSDALARDGGDEFILIGAPDGERRSEVAAVAAELGIGLSFDEGEASSVAELIEQLGF